MKYKAAIFDMDGLLLDSERIYGSAWWDVAQQQGIPMTWEMIHATIGMNSRVSEIYLKQQLGEDFDYHTFHEAARLLTYRRLDEEGVPLKPHARQILEQLRAQGWKLALATSTREHVARKYMDAQQLTQYFDEFCFGSEVERGKPYPDIFQLAAQRLGVACAECVVLEDSPNGIAAAHGAGMSCLWIPDQVLPEERPDTAALADCILPSLKEAEAWLADRRAGRRIRGAIFDMDGLLLDSEAQAMYAWPRAGTEMGYEITEQMVRDITGTNHVNCRRIMSEYLGADLDFDRLYHRAVDLNYERMLELNMPLRPYARQILEELQAAGIRLALGTSTNRARAEEELKIAGLYEFFDVFCFGNEVERGKPAPDIFLLAAERLGLESGECAVLEDSPNGVLAAVAAGMEAIWIPDQITCADRPDTAEAADAIFPTLKEAAQHILSEASDGEE